MKAFLRNRKSIIAAGAIISAAAVALLLPFNMGGCGVGGIDVGNAVGGITTLGKSASITEKDEPSLGETVAIQVTNRYPVYPDANLNRYVTLVGRTVAASSSMPGIDYYFAVLDTPEANAYSGPHGFVMITRGAVAKMKDESELAGVLGHEIGHICKHHGLDAVHSAMTKQGLVQLAGTSAKFSAFSQGAGALGDTILNTGFSQPQEMEADAEGVKFMAAAGYDPNGYLHLLQRFAAEQGRGVKLFATHPGMNDRVKKIQDQITKMKSTGGATNADRFAANVTLK
ncbi:MAG TPA: M48 family metalloprotease [Humisphaera sp.]|jgi:predicted Zn-dependent protease|nr:M48 family metalloprotease [Humisphaera sp.]